jgi:hypothetical protein
MDDIYRNVPALGAASSSVPSCLEATALLQVVDDRDRLDLCKAAGMRKRLDPDQCVDGLVVLKQLDPGRFDSRQVLVPVIDDEDGELDYPVRPGARAGERSTDVVECPTRLNRQVTGADDVALIILGDLPSNEHQPAAGRDNDLGVGLRRGEVLGIDVRAPSGRGA